MPGRCSEWEKALHRREDEYGTDVLSNIEYITAYRMYLEKSMQSLGELKAEMHYISVEI